MATEYDVFISYARKDDVPDASGKGWVTAIKELIDRESRAEQGREYRIFFDTEEIASMADWQARILGALRTSKILLVCLSPNYFASQPCRWEWEEYRQREVRMLAQLGVSETDQGTVASIFFVDPPGADPSISEQWRQQVLQRHWIDVRPWFPDGAKALESEALRSRMLELGNDIWKRIEQARRAETPVGNLMRFNPYFVGRVDDLRSLDYDLRRPAAIGVVTLVHGPGGLGKTELVVHYAHAYRELYGGGVWMLRAEGYRDILELAATLAREPRFGFNPPEDLARDPQQLGRAVLAELERRVGATANGDATDVLVFLDNVSEPMLLGEPQVAELPKNPHLRFVATSRLGPHDFARPAGVLQFLAIGELQPQDALTMIREHQPIRGSGPPDFADAQQEEAARGIAAALGGLALAVEQVAVYLGANLDVPPSEFLAFLQKEGVVCVEDEVTEDNRVAATMRHREKVLRVVLGQTLAALDRASATALAFASLLPSDAVPWPWLRGLILAVEPSVMPGKLGGWARVQRTLVSRRLLIQTAEPNTARIHRLHAAHLAQRAQQADRDAVAEFLGGRCEAVGEEEEPQTWELAALLESLPRYLASHPGLACRVAESGVLVQIGRTLPSMRSGQLAIEVANLLEEQVRQQPHDSELMGALAQAHMAVAMVADNWMPDAAAASARRTVVLLDSIVEQAADSTSQDADDAEGALLSVLMLAAANVEAYDPVAAAGFARRAVVLAESRVGRVPADLERRDFLSTALLIAARLVVDSDPAEARAMAERAVSVSEELKDTPGGQYGLSAGLTVLGRLLTDTEPRRARRYFRRALEIEEAIAREDPDSTISQESLAASLVDLAEATEDLDPTGSRGLRERALHIREAIVEARPGDMYALGKLAGSLNGLAGVLEGRDSEQARGLQNRAIGIYEDIVARQPADLKARLNLASALDILGQEIEDPQEALPVLFRALDLREEMLRAMPGSLDATRELAVSCNNVARTIADNDPERAIHLAQRAVDLCEQLVEADPDSSEAKRDLSYPLMTLADLLQDVHWKRALPYRVRALEIREALAAADPEGVKDLLRVSAALRELANSMPHDAAGVLDLRRRSAQASQRVIERTPDDHYALHEHAVHQVLLAEALLENDAEAALSLYESAVAHLRRTSSAMPKDELTWGVFSQALARAALLTDSLRGEAYARPYWQELCSAFDHRQRRFGLDEEEQADWLAACQKAGTNPPGTGWRSRWRRNPR